MGNGIAGAAGNSRTRAVHVADATEIHVRIYDSFADLRRDAKHPGMAADLSFSIEFCPRITQIVTNKENLFIRLIRVIRGQKILK